MTDNNSVIDWLLESDEPWTRLRTRLDLLGEKPGSPAAQADRREMVSHPLLLDLIASAGRWGERPFARHNDASYPIYKLTFLADLGFTASDPGNDEVCKKVMAHQSLEGAFQCLVSIPKAFGGDGLDHWTWMICDSPLLIYVLTSFGFGDDPRVQRARAHLLTLGRENGYGCVVDPALGRFHGPGKRSDPCPIANLFALRAFLQAPETWNHAAVQNAVEMLLAHWAAPSGSKYYLFGIGSSFRKLKAPQVWYDCLNVCETLSHFPSVRADQRFRSMAESLFAMADAEGKFTAASMYKSWDRWSFANKKNPSPWLTYQVMRIRRRLEEAVN